MELSRKTRLKINTEGERESEVLGKEQSFGREERNHRIIVTKDKIKT